MTDHIACMKSTGPKISTSKEDGLVKSPALVVPDLIQHPEHIEITGCRPSPECRFKGISDVLRNRQGITK
jgi:hypothetical protein